MKRKGASAPSARVNGPFGIHVAALAWLLLALGSTGFARQEVLRFVSPGDNVALGSAFDVGIEAEPGDLAGATVTDVRFGLVDDRWHISTGWRQPLSGGRPDENWLWSARLQAFEVGELQVPSVEVVMRRPDGTNEIIEIEGPVVNVVDGIDAADAELRDLQNIHPFRFDWRRVAAWAAVGLLAALALALLVRRSYLAHRADQAFNPPPPPGEWALGEIERRRNLPECRAGNSKFIATEASDVIRHFLQRQYGFNALDMTTRECVRHLEGKYVPGRLPPAAREFLEECDVVKFTRLDLAPGRAEAIWEDAKTLVALASGDQANMPTAEAIAAAGGAAR